MRCHEFHIWNLSAEEPERAISFYKTVFDWQIKKNGKDLSITGNLRQETRMNWGWLEDCQDKSERYATEGSQSLISGRC